MIWCLDETIGKSLNNQVVYSDDNGDSWSLPLDTQMAAQASNLFALPDNTLLAVHCVREGDCGVYLNHAEIVNGSYQLRESVKIWNAAATINIGSLADMGEGLKFGQPSILDLGDGEFMLIHWAMSGKKGRIIGHRVKVSC